MLSQITLGFFRMPPGPNRPGAAGTPGGGREATSLGSLKGQDGFQHYVQGDQFEIQARDVSKAKVNMSKLCSSKLPKFQTTSPSS